MSTEGRRTDFQSVLLVCKALGAVVPDNIIKYPDVSGKLVQKDPKHGRPKSRMTEVVAAQQEYDKRS